MTTRRTKTTVAMHPEEKWRVVRRRTRTKPKPKPHLALIICHNIAHPIAWLASKIHPTAKQKNHRRKIEVAIGLVLMMVGSTLAVNAVSWCPTHVPHPVYDMVAYGLHGFGAAPIIKTIAGVFGMEV